LKTDGVVFIFLCRQHFSLQLLHSTGAELTNLGSVDDALALSQKLTGLPQLLWHSARTTESSAHDASLGDELSVLGDLGLDAVEADSRAGGSCCARIRRMHLSPGRAGGPWGWWCRCSADRGRDPRRQPPDAG